MSSATDAQVTFQPAIHVPRKLSGLVDFFGEFHQENPGRALIMPGGKVEIIFFLEGNDLSEFYMGSDEASDRGKRKDSSLIFSVTNLPQVVTGRAIHIILALMSPAAAMLLFGIPASELKNKSVNPSNFGVDVRPLEDALNSLSTFEQRAEFLENWMLRRLERVESVPEFVSFSQSLVDLCNDSRLVPDTSLALNLTSYSTSQANRLSKQWLGVSLERYLSLQRYRKALNLINTSMPLADVAATAGYFDQAHFTHRFTEFSGISPSQYRLTPRTGVDTLHVS